jgi:ribose-phosphate pyrophosphokinase
MKTSHVVIPTSAAQYLFRAGIHGPVQIPADAQLIIPTANKEASYRFPDGEVYLRVPGLKHAKKITIVHSGYPHPNDGLIELYMLLNIIMKYNPSSAIEVIFTAIPYARQDKAYYEGELNAAEMLIRTLTELHRVSKIIVIDAHFANERWTKKLPLLNVSMASTLMEYAAMKNPNIIFMTPDAGSTRRTHIKGATKKRQNSFSVEVSVAELSPLMRGREIGVVDDILATGTTLERFYREAKRFGAKKVFALITHGVNESGIQRIHALYDGLYMTNTIDRPEANVSVAYELTKLIERSGHAHH